jgi:hypothetical protein
MDRGCVEDQPQQDWQARAIGVPSEIKECNFLRLVFDTAAVRFRHRAKRSEIRKRHSTALYPSAALRVIIGWGDTHDAGFRH